ncbi:hypothetical protein F4782DRAFT_533469 [Xylaria castorea]|nr:hypothetical protein F4782DRAFT_533469 [Xylaria castorea]
MPALYQIINGERLSYDAYVKHIAEWRAKISEDEFLRDGDQPAAHMTGTIHVDGVGTRSSFESFIFAKGGQREWEARMDNWTLGLGSNRRRARAWS